MTSMPTRQLGKNGPKVSAIGFGAMGLSAFYGTPAPDEERFKVLDRVIELGSTYIDSADIYGDNEELLNKYFTKNPGQREKVSDEKGEALHHSADQLRSFWQPNSQLLSRRTVHEKFEVMLNMFAKQLQKVYNASALILLICIMSIVSIQRFQSRRPWVS